MSGEPSCAASTEPPEAINNARRLTVDNEVISGSGICASPLNRCLSGQANERQPPPVNASRASRHAQKLSQGLGHSRLTQARTSSSAPITFIFFSGKAAMRSPTCEASSQATDERVGTGPVQLAITSDELPPQSQLSNLAPRVGLDRSCQEAQAGTAPDILESGTATNRHGADRPAAQPCGQHPRHWPTPHDGLHVGRNLSARPLAVREMQPDLAALVFDLVPEAPVLRSTQCRPEDKP